MKIISMDGGGGFVQGGWVTQDHNDGDGHFDYDGDLLMVVS